MPSGIQDNTDVTNGLLTEGSRFEHLTMTKSGRVKERKHLSRSPTFLRATHIGKGPVDNDQEQLPTFTDPKKCDEVFPKEHVYATIGEMRHQIAVAKRGTENTIAKSLVRRCKSSNDELSSTKTDFNMNLTTNRKRNSNTESGLFVRLESAEAETRTAELCTLKDENQKLSKLFSKNGNESKKNEKENKEPQSTDKDVEATHILPKHNVFAATAKKSFAKRSFRQSKKLTMAEQSKPTEMSMNDLLKNKGAINVFHEFLKSEFSEENLDFWLECETYKTVKDSKIPKAAFTIFSEYLAKSANRPVNVDSGIRTRTEERLKNPDRETFVEAQDCIYSLMKSDPFRRFLASEKYKKLKESNDPFKNLIKRGSSRRK